MRVYKDGNGMYGHCWIEGDGATFWLYIMNGQSKKGPYSNLSDALEEFRHWCNG